MIGDHRKRGVFRKVSFHVGPNMTPMVDVVMCILIFFMLGSTLTRPDLFLKSDTAALEGEGLGTQPGAARLPAVRMKITLTRHLEGGRAVTRVAAFDDEPMEMDGARQSDQSRNERIFAKLAARRKTISDDVQVLIVPDRNVPWQDVITIYDYCTKLAFKQVAFYPIR